MERVAFLIEETGERIGCLLNPENVVLRREAGIHTRRFAGGLIAGTELADDQLLYRGGGNTELTMNLLFDVSVAGSSIAAEDVRDLTGPLWRLAESARSAGAYTAPPVCRFVWGKSWQLPGLITAVAEKLDSFTQAGIPRRSLMRLRFRRVMDPVGGQPRAEGNVHRPIIAGGGGLAAGLAEMGESREVLGGERPDQLAYERYGDPDLARALMTYNDIDDPLHMAPGALLDMPPLSELEDLA